MSFEDFSEVLTISNKGRSSFNNIDKGIYDIYLNGKDEAFLFTMTDNNKILKCPAPRDILRKRNPKKRCTETSPDRKRNRPVKRAVFQYREREVLYER